MRKLFLGIVICAFFLGSGVLLIDKAACETIELKMSHFMPTKHTQHKVILEFTTRNKIARRLFSFMDDLFYGKRPKPKAAPKWARFSTGNMDETENPARSDIH